MPTSIDRSGAQDVTTELMAFIAAAPDGCTITFPPASHYRIEGTLRIRNRNALTFEGNGARFFADNASPPEYAVRDKDGKLVRYPWRNRYHWTIEGGSGITLRNMTIRGANAQGGQGSGAYVVSHEAQHGVNVSGAEGVRIEDVNISHVFGDFVYLGGLTVTSPVKHVVLSRNITVTGGQWSHNGRQGLAITNADGVLVDNINMTETRRASIDLEPNSASAIIRNITIRNSHFGPGRLNWLAAGGAAGTMEDIALIHNRGTRPLNVVVKTPPDGRRRVRWSFIDNRSTASAGSPRALMEISRVDGLVIRDNLAQLRPERNMTAVELTDCTDWIHEGNEWRGAAKDLVIK